MVDESAATGGRSAVIRIAAVAIAAAIVVELVGLAGWRLYDHWSSGRIVLTNQGPALSVQVLDESGEVPVGDPFDLVAESVLTLPDGDYRLRVNGEGRLGRTYRFAVNRGETVEHELSLDEGRLLGGERWRWPEDRERSREEPRPFAPITAALELTPGRADLIEYNGQTIIRRDGRTGRPVWDVSRPSGPEGPLREPDAAIRTIPTDAEQVSLVDPPPDLNGDGVNDLVWLFHDHPTLLAVSGQDGSVLWSHSEAPPGNGPSRPRAEESGVNWGCVVRSPAVADVDRDGVPDLIATIHRAGNPADVFHRVVVAVSGRSGRPIWTAPADITGNPMPSSDRAAALVPGRRSPLIAYVDDNKWIGLDPATGRSKVGPFDLGFQPVRAVQYADLDGDGEPEAVALGPGPIKGQQSLVAIACGTGRTLWTQTIPAPLEGWAAVALPLDRPWLLDLDGDGRTEVIIPDHGTMPPASDYQGVRVLDGATGQTRWVRPMCRQNDDNDGLARLAEAPDLDGDGVRELIAISVFQGWTSGAIDPKRAFVDALSGKDGHPLWSWSRSLPPGRRYVRTGPVRWWGRGPDGWPLLAIPLGGDQPPRRRSSEPSLSLLRPVVHVLESSTGRELHTALGLEGPEVADLDGDGLLDLWGEADGQLRAFRGESPEAWRALGGFKPADWAPPFRPPRDPRSHIIDLAEFLAPTEAVTRPRAGSDLDGDGFGDALIENVHSPGVGVDGMTGSHTAIARSGRDGRVIWKTRLGPSWHGFDRDSGDSYTFTTSPLPMATSTATARPTCS
jgi:hypothetical protein